MTLHLVRMRPDARRLARFAQAARLPDADPGYLWHYALRQTFGEAAPQPFRVLEPETGNGSERHAPQLLGYARTDAVSLRTLAERAPAEVGDIFPPGGIDDKVMPDAFAAGRRLAFSVRVCPIVRTASSDGKRRRELDVFVHAASAVPDEPKPDRAGIYREWLAQRLAGGGAGLIDARLAAFRLGDLVRRSHASSTGRTDAAESRPKRLLASSGRGAARRPDAVLEGVLEVADPARFAAVLARGIGRHRAFGFGMLLLRPVG